MLLDKQIPQQEILDFNRVHRSVDTRSQFFAKTINAGVL